MLFITIFCSIIFFNKINGAELPSVYDYYTKGGIKSGLKAEGTNFTLNGKEIRILSGSLHYFRVVPEYWKDRLLKMRASGLNTVQFYSPWNLHEEIPEHFNFEGILNLEQFLKDIKEMDMFAIFRPGPYICAEWDLGGLPSWLLRDPNMKVRSVYEGFKNATKHYYEKLMSVVKNYQFSTNGGPIIAVQVENEYSSFGNVGNEKDKEYLEFIRDTLINLGIRELLFTSDPEAVTRGSLPDLLKTGNLYNDAKEFLGHLSEFQPKKPNYVAEFWTGAWHRWGEKLQHQTANDFGINYESVLFEMHASANIYMFHGGTNFGFASGAVLQIRDNAFNYVPEITTYVMYTPISEEGDYTDKYWKTKEIIEKLETHGNIPIFKKPSPPKVSVKANYGSVKITHYIPFETMLKMINPIALHEPVTMENLNIGSNYGQRFGFILYRTKIPKIHSIRLVNGAKDRAIIYIDHKSIATIEFTNKDKSPTFNISDNEFSANVTDHVLDIFVENMGRVNWGWELNQQRKGLRDKVYVDDNVQREWNIYPIDFNHSFVNGLNNTHEWKPYDTTVEGPTLLRAQLNIDGQPKDTFLKMDHPWKRGAVFINQFNVGRYFDIGPQKTLYIPAPLLKMGHNDIYIFEVHASASHIEFVDKPLYM